jgi:hypothetical protein
MARQRELLSLVEIAEETGISYATLRSYAIKYDGEIPSEGSGRNTRYPRAAVKVFQRLRQESKPGRKPASATALAAPAPANPQKEMAPVSPQAVADPSGIERELAAIRAHLGSIAESLGLLVGLQEKAAAKIPAAPEPVLAAQPMAPVMVEEKPAEKPAIPEAARGLREVDSGGHRRPHSSGPKVWGQRGRRPE